MQQLYALKRAKSRLHTKQSTMALSVVLTSGFPGSPFLEDSSLRFFIKERPDAISESFWIELSFLFNTEQAILDPSLVVCRFSAIFLSLSWPQAHSVIVFPGWICPIPRAADPLTPWSGCLWPIAVLLPRVCRTWFIVLPGWICSIPRAADPLIPWSGCLWPIAVLLPRVCRTWFLNYLVLDVRSTKSELGLSFRGGWGGFQTHKWTFFCCEALAKQQHYFWLTVRGLGAL